MEMALNFNFLNNPHNRRRAEKDAKNDYDLCEQSAQLPFYIRMVFEL